MSAGEQPERLLPRLLKGFVVGQLLAVCGVQLLMIRRLSALELALPALLALAMVGPRWLRRATWLAAGAIALLSFAVMHTPFVEAVERRWVVHEGPAAADVIVVLSGGTNAASLTPSSQDRWVTGLRLLHAGYAAVIVFTGDGDPGNQFNEMAPALMSDIGLATDAVVPFEIPAHTGVLNTHGEAAGIAAMARAHGWRSVLLVTSRPHTRRAHAVFERAGLTVRVVGAQPVTFDQLGTVYGYTRVRLFRSLLREALLYRLYRWHGWL